jgi:hypothetical protein
VTPDELRGLLPFLSADERKELDAILAADIASCIWRPLPGPQTMAYESLADVIGFGGAAGGGKTDLAVGKALSQHQVVQIMRREGTELNAIIDRMEQIVGTRDGLGGKPPVWRAPWGNCRLIEFGSAPNLGDEKKFQGRAKDLLVIDEAANWLEQQVRFLMGWVRTVALGQRTQTLLTFNPPTSAEGRWLIPFFGPWLDKKFAGERAMPGELRYVAVINGKDAWVDSSKRFVLVKGQRVYDFDPADFRPDEIITPQSRTFIPSRITDNPYLLGTNYMTQLQALPEPLRSQMLRGDFEAGMEDDPWQVIPTAWVEAAQARWKPRSPRGEMLAMGVDVARGGKDNTTIATRHQTDTTAHWFGELKPGETLLPGADTPNGPMVAGLVIAQRRDDAPVMIDVIGVGASPYDKLNELSVQVLPINVSEKAQGTDKSGTLRFNNQRSELWWRFRELLDPANDFGAALPPDQQLLAELCAPKWRVQGKCIEVESREEIVKRIGRSPDRATAFILANIDVPKIKVLQAANARMDTVNYDPMAHMRNDADPSLDYDPMGRI